MIQMAPIGRETPCQFLFGGGAGNYWEILMAEEPLGDKPVPKRTSPDSGDWVPRDRTSADPNGQKERNVEGETKTPKDKK